MVVPASKPQASFYCTLQVPLLSCQFLHFQVTVVIFLLCRPRQGPISTSHLQQILIHQLERLLPRILPLTRLLLVKAFMPLSQLECIGAYT